MANFKITTTTTVAELKEQFHNEFGGILRVYEGRSEAPEDATLVSLGGKVGELECRASRTVGKFEEAFQEELGLKVKVYTKDNWVTVLDGITLATVREIPKSATKAKMEQFLAYQRDEKEGNRKIEAESVIQDFPEIAWNEDKVVSAYLYMPLSELADFEKTKFIKAKECTAEFFPFLTGEDLEIALKNTRGIYMLPYCSNILNESQWKNVEQNGEGVCVAVELMYNGWEKNSIFNSSLYPFIDDDTKGIDILTVRLKDECLQYDGILSSVNPSNPFIPFKITTIVKRNEVEGINDASTYAAENAELENSLSAEEGWKATEKRVDENPKSLPNPNAIYFVINSEPRHISDEDEECGEEWFVAYRAIKDCQYFYGVCRYDPHELADELGVDLEDIEVYDMDYSYDSVENYPSGKNIYLPQWLYELYTSPESNIAELCPDGDSEPINAAIDCCLTNESIGWSLNQEVPCILRKANGSHERVWFAQKG